MQKEKISPKKKGSNGHEKVNWLEHWGNIPFTADPDDSEKIKEIKRRIRVYVRGELAEYNAVNETNYVVIDFEFDRRNRSPLEYDVKAFLQPSAERAGHGDEGGDHDEDGGGHLIPRAPHPPTGT